jgi:hypothetical protein
MEKRELEVIVAAIIGGAAYETCATEKSIDAAVDCFTVALRTIQERRVIENALHPG